MVYNDRIKTLERTMFEQISFFESAEKLHTSLTKGRYLLLVADKTDIAPLATLPDDIAFVGAVFPRVIYRHHTYDTGIIVAKMSDSTLSCIVPMDNTTQLKLPEETNAVLTFIDGYSIHTDRFLEVLYAQLPEQARILGAGAGKMTLDPASYLLFDNTQRYTNYAIVVASKQSVGLGIKHGWTTVMGPFIATHCSGHTLEKINFQDAYSVYRSIVEKISDIAFDQTPFFTIAQRFPLGIVRYNKDFIIREPFSTNGQSLTLNAQIDANSVISILEGKADAIIEAAREAAVASLHVKTQAHSNVLLIDCISRYLLLKERYGEELEAITSVYDSAIPLWGVLSLGEIANANQEGIEFYNNTCVIGTL